MINPTNVVLPTVEFYVCTPRNVLEYDAKTKEDGTKSFEPMHVHRTMLYHCVYVCIRSDGKRQKLSDFL